MKIKKIISGIMAVLVIFGTMPVLSTNPVKDYAVTANAAENGTYENLEYRKYSNYITISGCDESAAEVVIPAEIEGLPVTGISYRAFKSCSGLTSVTIPDSVKSISDSAFEDCSKLTSIIIPDSVTNIGDSAFNGTPWLEAKQKENPLVIINNILIDCTIREGDVIIPDGVTSIGSHVFYKCSSLKSVTIPDSVTSIGNDVFYDCSGLTSMTIPDSVTRIGSSAFAYCSGLTSIKIPDGVKRIEYSTFDSCSGLKSITIPDSVTTIGSSAFNGTPWLEAKQKENPFVVVNNILIDGTTCEGDVVIPDGIKSINNSAFFNCSGLTSITVPAGITDIGSSAFYNCSNLTSITILNPDCKIYDYSNTICSEYDKGNGEYHFDGTIYGYENSTAQEYAEKYGRKFEVIDGEIEAPEILLGDANCDGEISVADATLVLQYCGNKDKYKLTEQGLINADVDGTAGISAVDALRIQQYDAGVIDKF